MVWAKEQERANPVDANSRGPTEQVRATLAHRACITAPATSHPGTATVARTPVFGVRGSSLAKTGNLKGGRLPSGSEARVSGRTADLKGGGLRYARSKALAPFRLT